MWLTVVIVWMTEGVMTVGTCRVVGSSHCVDDRRCYMTAYSCCVVDSMQALCGGHKAL